MSFLAGLDLHTGRATEIVSDHHASADFIALLGKLDEAYHQIKTIAASKDIFYHRTVPSL